MDAYQKEQQFYGDHNPFVIEDYRKVIEMEPGSAWADKAQKRIDAIQQNINADRAVNEQQTNELLHSH